MTDKHTFAICAYGKSPYLEQCIKSIIKQTASTKVVMCTSTPSSYISRLANKYDIPLHIKNSKSNIRDDWNYAYNLADTELVTVAHQDDVYHKDYVKYMLERFTDYDRKDIVMYFTGYRPLKKSGISLDINCILRGILRSPMRIRALQKNGWWKKHILSLGNSICCPTVTYNKSKLGENIFTSEMAFNIDWDTFYKLSGVDGYFVYEPKALVLYRVHNQATSKTFIENNKRYDEDIAMFEKFWGKKISSLIMKLYVKAYDTYN